ncbi:hypothetical protein RUND412_001710 [Rhizina undulata]
MVDITTTKTYLANPPKPDEDEILVYETPDGVIIPMMRNDRSFIPAMQFATVPAVKRSEPPKEEPQKEKPADADDGQVWMYLQEDGTWDFKSPEEKKKEKEKEGPKGTFNYWNLVVNTYKPRGRNFGFVL